MIWRGLLAVCAASQLWAAETLICHVTYGGETQVLRATAATSPYAVAPKSIGSYFMFRMLLESTPKDQAAIKLYVYADRDYGPVPISHSVYPYPLRGKQGPYGFTGLQWVYEPVRDGEMQYWCELQGHPK